MRILIVEDEPSQQVLLRQMLRSAVAAEVRIAGTLPEARKALAEDCFDAVLLDLGIPGGGGTSTYHLLRTHAAGAAVVIVTALADEDLARELLQAGAQDYLTKGKFDVDGLRRAVNYAIERERLQRDLRRYEAKLQVQYANTPVAMFTWQRTGDGDFALIDANDEAMSQTGGIVQSWIGLRASEQLSEVPLFIEGLHRAWGTRMPIKSEIEMGAFRSTKKTLFQMTFAFMDPDLVLVYAEDVGRQREAEQALRASELRYRTLFEQAPAGIVVITGTGHIIEANQRTADLTGYTPDELVGMDYHDFLLVSDRLADPPRYDDLFLGDILNRERVLLRKDGSTFIAEIRAARLEDGNILASLRNVTELRHSQERLSFQANLLASVENSIMATDAAGRITYWNHRACDHLGFTAEEVMGRDLIDTVILPRYRDEARQRYAALLATGADRWEGRYDAVRKDGSALPMYGTISILRDAAGQVTGTIGVSFDIAKLKAEEHERRRNELMLLQILENLPVGVFIVDPDGKIVSSNPAGRAIWAGERQVGPEGYGEFRAWHRDGQPIGPRDWPIFRALQQGEPTIEEEIEIETFDGVRKRILNSAIPVVARGTLLCAVVVNQDITERRRTEEALRESEERFRTMIENGSDIISIVGADGRIRYESPSIERCLGWKPEELVGRAAFDFLRPHEVETLLAQIAKQNVAPETPMSMRIDFRHRDGSYRTFEVITQGFRNERGEWDIIANSRDITQRSILEKRLEQADRISSLGRLATTIAHEINNVLMGIQPFTEVIRRRAAEDATLTRAADQISRSVQRGRRVTQEILRFARPAEPTRKTFAVQDLVDLFAGEAQTLAPPSLELDITSGEADVYIDADLEQLMQVFTNLLLNARDAMPGGGRFSIRCEAEDTTVRIDVSDTGSGIDPGYLRHIFDPLFTTKKTGTGLGLSVVHQIVTMHHGEITVDSVPNEGTTFHIRLPRAEPPERNATADARDASGPGPQLQRVLVVDDDDAVALGLTYMLEDQGFTVRTVDRAAEVVAAMESFRPELVLLDYRLQDGTGADVWREIHERWPETPVIFSTGQGEVEALRDIVTTGRAGYLLKPYEMDALLAEIRRLKT